MERILFFCKSWFRAKKQPTEMWSAKAAQRAHENGQPYTVLVDSEIRPICFLEVEAKTVGVCFLDDLLRETLTYHFQEVEPGRLFLTMATYREFLGVTDKVAVGTSYVFARDGTVQMRRESFDPYRLETATSSADIAANYSPSPSFGEYADLIRSER